MKNHLVLSLIALAVGLGCAIPTNAAAEDHGWPREIKSPKARILLYEPQLESLEKTTLKERSAISVTPAGKTEPVFGVIWADAQVAIDRDDRTVHFLSIDVTRVRFPGSTPEQEKDLETLLEKEFPKWDLTYSLDRMIAGLEQASKEKSEAEGFKNDPPKVIFADRPTVLVVLDGDPKELPIQGTSLKRVVNTPYFLVSDADDGDYFLGANDFWFKAKEIHGPWKEINSPPKSVAAALEKEQKQAAARNAGGGAPPQPPATTPQPAATAEKGPTPEVIVSTVPAELIVSNGAPKWNPITGTDLLYMSNTDGDVIKELDSQKNYVLLSGRWYRAESFDGPWEFVRPDALPESFASIPERSAAGDVQAHVSGTPQAEEAMVDAQLPQTSAIERSKATTEVTYDGEPQFKAIPKTKIEYAVNTGSEVLKIKGMYYVCEQGVWYVSNTPTGPWAVADSVPDEVQQIPPESPMYNTKYVYVYDSTPDWVYVGYLPGYLGCYPYYNTVVYGTGWYYPGWYGSVYYPHPLTWGFGAHYNSYYGWSFGVSFGFGFGYGYGYPYYGYASFGYPYYGYPYYGYPYSYGWWGPGGYCYRPTHATVTVNNNYGPRQPRGDWQHPSHVPRGQNNLYKRPGNAPRNASVPHDRGSARPVPPHAANLPNNVYAGRDGNVYRRTNSGWQRRDPSGWKPAPQTQDGSNGLPHHPTTGSAMPPAGHPTGGHPTGGRPAPGSAPPAPSAPVSHGPGTHGPPPSATAPPGHAAPGAPPATGRPAGPPPRPSAPPSSLERSYQARERGSARVQGYRGGGGGGARPPAGGGGRPHGGGHH
jgi:hypothetical protein